MKFALCVAFVFPLIIVAGEQPELQAPPSQMQDTILQQAG
jgi:hypothetical protein